MKFMYLLVNLDDPAQRHMLKIAIAGAAIVLAAFWWLVKRGTIRGVFRVIFDVLLVAVAGAAVFAYFEFGWLRYGQYMNPHDVYHYYMGAKYSQEHGYFNLYRCSYIADREMRGVFKKSAIRNLDTHGYESVAQVWANREKCKAAFTPERWQEFKADIRYFQSVMPTYKWQQVLGDKGYNATPVWNALARLLTENAPTNNRWAMRFLTYIDLVLLVVMFGFVWAAFGWRVMLFAIIFHGTNYFMAFVHIKGAFMRLDWIAGLVIGLCLLKLRWYKTAGGVLAYAGMARVFPVIFVFGIGVKALFNGLAWLRDRIFRRPNGVALSTAYLGFFIAFGAVLILLVAASAWYDGGFQLWGNFAKKIAVHNNDISTTRAGFKYIFLWNDANKGVAFQQHQTLWRVIMGVVLLATAFLTRKLEDYETLPLGFIPVFFLAAPTFYYYVMLLVPLFLFVPKTERLPRVFGVMLMFGVSIAAYATGFRYEHNFTFFYICSWMLLSLCAYIALTALLPVPVAAATPAATPELAPPARRRVPRRPLASFGGGLFAAAAVGVAALAAITQLQKPQAPAGPAIKQGASQRTLVFVGDVMLSRNVARRVAQQGGDFTYPFQRVAPYLQQADLAFCNMECPVSGRGARVEKQYTFNAPPEAVAGPVFAGFDVVSLANNHILDFGPAALEDTVRLLESRRIQTVGLTERDAPQKPVIVDLSGLRVGFLAYCDPETPYAFAKEYEVFETRPAKATRDALTRDIPALKSKVDIVVVSMHWGIEYVPEPTEHQRELGRYLIDQGAHIVAGHHQHVQQEPEAYKEGLILHGMGNFVFDQYSRPLTRLSRLYRIVVDNAGLVRAEYLPLEIPQNEWQPRPTAQAFVPVPLKRQPVSGANTGLNAP